VNYVNRNKNVGILSSMQKISNLGYTLTNWYFWIM